MRICIFISGLKGLKQLHTVVIKQIHTPKLPLLKMKYSFMYTSWISRYKIQFVKSNNNKSYSDGLMPPRLTSTSPSETIDSVTFSSSSPEQKH